MQQGVAQPLGLGGGHVAFEHQALGKGEEVLGHADQLDPAGVVGEVAEGQVAQAGVLGTADAILYAGVATVAGFEIGDVGVGRVGDEDLVPPAVRIKEVELGPVVGLFSSDDGPGASRPMGEVEIRSARPPLPRRGSHTLR